MARTKRCLTLIRVMLWIGTGWTALAENTLIITPYHCITNSSSALSFNTPLEANSYQSSKLYPKPKNDLQIYCKMNNNTDCTALWTIEEWLLQDSVDGPINQPITDWRWEELPQIKTGAVLKKNEEIKFLYTIGKKRDFRISFSVRIQKEAHVFLCNKANFKQSTCYRILLKACGGTKSDLRIHNPGDDIYPSNLCSTNSNTTVLIQNETEVLTEDEWRHFEINKIGDTLTVFSVTPQHTEILSYTNATLLKLPKINHIAFHSKVAGLWKLHNYTYIYCNKRISAKQIGPETIVLKNGENCISIFVVTCRECELYFQVWTVNDEQIYYKALNTPNEKWTEIKLLINSERDVGSKFYVTTRVKKRDYSKMFWAIGDVRSCNAVEYRYLEIDPPMPPGENIKCQLISNGNVIKFPKEVDTVSNTAISCPEETFGSNCIPCSLITGRANCNQFKYCEIVGKNNKICHCSSGYRDNTCEKDCSSGWYGHGCKKNCGLCSNKCEKIDGNCNPKGCKDDFKGNKCDISPHGLFAKSPKIKKKDLTSCTIQIENDILEGSEGKPCFYMIQYKKSSTSEWQSGNQYNVNYQNEIVIENLEPDSNYYVRAVLSITKDVVYKGDYIKYSEFRTKCNGIKQDQIVVTAFNTTATIVVNQLPGSCKISNYEYYISPNTTERKNAINNLTITNLQPCQTYQLTFVHIYSHIEVQQNFTTKKGVPSAIRNLKNKTVGAREAELTWEEPNNQYCDIKYYNVTYQRIKGLACRNVSKEYKILNNRSVNTSVELKNLTPYSEYEIKIAAVVDTIKGEELTKTISTLQTDILDREEVPKILNNTSTPITISLHLSTINCDKLQGPIYFNVKVTCKTDWCVSQQQTELFSHDLPTETLILRNLKPYVTYAVVMNISRFKDKWDNSTIVRDLVIMTEPSTPQITKNFTSPSQGYNWIKLRWAPSFPPTGVLNMYKIRYESSNYKKETIVKPSACRLWPEYHCATIEQGIQREKTYKIQILATNEVPQKYAMITDSIKVIASVKAPNPPIQLFSEWLEDYTLNISWMHPFYPNAAIKEFRIALIDDKPTPNKKEISYNLTSENDYKLVYSYQVNATDLSGCSRYKLIITSRNERRVFSAPARYDVSDWSPPPVLNFTNTDLETSYTNHTITVQIPTQKQQLVKTVNTTLYLFVSNASDDATDELKQFEISLRHNNPITTHHSRLVLKTIGQNSPTKFHIGNAAANIYRDMYNPPLDFDKEYYINLFYVNECFRKVRVYRLKTNVTIGNLEVIMAATSDNNNNGLFALILLVLLVPLGIYIYRKRNGGSTKINLRHFQQSPRERNVDRIPLTNNAPLVRREAAKPTVKPNVSLKNTHYVLNTTHSKPIAISDYEAYVKEAIECGELERQHNLFPKGQTKPWEYGSLNVNKPKNRYKNLIAYDHTRVKLNKISGDEYSDYINANFIDGYRLTKTYIATQGPKASTLNDFWRMIWQYRVQNIVMLANIIEGGKKKVEKYWPDLSEDKYFDGIRVQYVSSKVFADYEHRVFNIYNRGEQRKVEQLHFTSWPDHGIPLYSQSLLPFLQRILKIPIRSNHPVVVHCSAGVGRTGTIILCDICLRMAAMEGSVDFLGNLEHLRTQRPNLVDNIEQYKLAHIVVLECLVGMRTSIDCSDDIDIMVDHLIKSNGIRKYMKYLKDTEWQDKAMDTVWDLDAPVPIYPEKNRFEDIVPEQQYRVGLSPYPYEDETSSYINAVYVDGFRSPDRYIVTQQPMPNTLGDFWRLVNETGCTVILSLNEINPKDRTSCQFWPKNGTEMIPVDFLTVRHTKTKVFDGYTLVKVHLIRKNESVPVTIISMQNWMPGELLPQDSGKFLSFWEESDVILRNSHPIIITCYDGATASGLYIATSFVIEKINLEHVCDVCLAVRKIRHNRSQFVTSKEQFEYLYRISSEYVKSFQCYANFA